MSLSANTHFDDKDLFDVTLACDDEQIQAHKVILSASCPLCLLSSHMLLTPLEHDVSHPNIGMSLMVAVVVPTSACRPSLPPLSSRRSLEAWSLSPPGHAGLPGPVEEEEQCSRCHHLCCLLHLLLSIE